MFNTYEQQVDLVKRGLAIEKKHPTLPLSLFKYHRRVMFDYLWFKIPELMECRGHVYDNQTGKLIVAAPRKSFNYLENGWWQNMSLDSVVRAEKKYNGYLACATKYNDELLVTTTGSFDSEFAVEAKKMIEKDWNIVGKNTCTWHFEICAEFDPHIVKEKVGVKLIQVRYQTGYQLPTTTEDSFNITLGDAIDKVKTYRGEGFMLHTSDGDVCKLKSPYYVGKKMIMRMNDTKVEKMYRDTDSVVDTLPVMWHDAPYLIVSKFTINEWKETPEFNRRQFLEIYFGD